MKILIPSWRKIVHDIIWKNSLLANDTAEYEILTRTELVITGFMFKRYRIYLEFVRLKFNSHFSKATPEC